MAPLTAEKNPFLAGFDAFLAARRESGLVTELRCQAMRRFEAQGIPTRRLENWRNTDLSRLAKTAFAPAMAPGPVATEQLASYRIAGAREMVFVDGFYVPELSTPGSGEQLLLTSLAAIVTDSPEEAIPRTFDPEAAVDRDTAFAALNRAYWQDGIYLSLGAGQAIPEPMHLIYLTTSGEGPKATYPRNLIVAHPGSEATVIETYVGNGQNFTCPLTEVHVLGNAGLDHYRRESEGNQTIHVANTLVHLSENARFHSLVFAAGAGLVRHDLFAHLGAAGGEATLNGLYLTGDHHHTDHHLWVRHAAAHTASRQVYKGILAGHGRAVFNGNIHVEAGAVKTDAKQSNRNLLLSDEALVHTNPQLEIYAGDVRCTHGSTVGQLDEDAMFYLRARGIGAQEARRLLTTAFAADLFDDMRIEALRTTLLQQLSDWLSADFTGETL